MTTRWDKVLHLCDKVLVRLEMDEKAGDFGIDKLKELESVSKILKSVPQDGAAEVDTETNLSELSDEELLSKI